MKERAKIIEVDGASIEKRDDGTYLHISFNIPPSFPLQFSPGNDDQVRELYRQVFGAVMPTLRPILGDIGGGAEDKVVARAAAEESARVREYQWGTGLEVIYGKIIDHLKSIGCPAKISGAGHEGMDIAGLSVMIPVKDSPQAVLDVAACLKTTGLLRETKNWYEQEVVTLEQAVTEAKTQLSGEPTHHDFLVKLNQGVFKDMGPASGKAASL